MTGSNVKLIFSDHANSREQVVIGGWRQAVGSCCQHRAAPACHRLALWTRQMNQALGLWKKKKKMIPLTFLVQPEPGESGAASGLPPVQKTHRLSRVSEGGTGLCEDDSANKTRLKC